MSTQPEEPNFEACEDIIEVRCRGAAPPQDPGRDRGNLHFRIVDGDIIEIKCKHCSDRDSVVLHRYSLSDGTLQTLRLREIRGRGARSHRKETP